MPQLNASIKDLRKSKRHAVRNRSWLSKVKTVMKKVRASKTTDAANTALGTAIKTIDKAATKGILHRRTADRYKSRLASFVKRIGK